MTKAKFYEWIETHKAKAIRENVVSRKAIGVYAYVPGKDIPGDERIFYPVTPEIWNSTYSSNDGTCLVKLYPPQEWMLHAPYYDG